VKNVYIFLILFPGITVSSHANICNFKNDNDFLVSKSEIKDIQIEADKSLIHKKNIFELSGNVELKSSDFLLNAASVNIDRHKQKAIASGKVNFKDKFISILGDLFNLDYGIQGNKKSFLASNAEYSLNSSNIRGDAKVILGNNRFQELTNATFTQCPPGNNSWNLAAEKIILDSSRNIGKAEDVSFKFMGTPILYLPYYEWVLQGKGSGFLSPKLSFFSENENIGDSAKDVFVSIPYYFLIAPDKDLLFSINHYSSRGNEIETKYRSLLYMPDSSQIGRYESDLSFLADDNIENKSRWQIKNSVNLNLDQSSRFEILHHRVSDTEYFKDLTVSKNNYTSLLSYVDFQNSSSEHEFKIRTENEQTLYNGSDSYTKNLELRFKKDIPINADFTPNVEFSHVTFKNKDSSKIEANRENLKIKFSKKYNFDNLEISPTIDFNSSYYSLNNEKNVNRNILSFQFASESSYEKNINLFGDTLTQTLVPKLVYSYSSKENQSNIPLFDTEERTGIFDSIIGKSKFTSIDRIENNNNVLLHLNSDLYNPLSGETLFEAHVAQKFFLNNQILNSAGNFSNLEKKYSDIALKINTTNDQINFTSELLIDPSNNNINSSINTLTYTDKSLNSLSLGFIDDSEENLLFHGNYKLNSKLKISGTLKKSLSSNVNNEVSADLDFNSCCLSYKISHNKIFKGTNDWDHITNFELIFKGLTTPTNRQDVDVPNYFQHND